jgi:hypothetical protein
LHYVQAKPGGMFMPLPWSALANPLEPLRGLWQLHVGGRRHLRKPSTFALAV